MAEINITLLSNKQNLQENAEDLKIIAFENKATTVAVRFPSELVDYSKRVDFQNVRGEKWTEALYAPEDERNEYAPGFDTCNFTFTLPEEILLPGELLLEFIAYKANAERPFIPFDMVRLTVEAGIGFCRKRARNNPDLIIKAYENSNNALDIARQSLSRTMSAEDAAERAAASASAAETSAQASQESSAASENYSLASAQSAAAALQRAIAAEESAATSVTAATVANARAGDAETAAANSAASAASANTRATNAETAANNAASLAASANTRATNAETAAANAATSASQSAASAASADTRAGNAEEAAIAAAASAAAAVSQSGTEVSVGGILQNSIDFDSDPQTQINTKLPKADLLNLIYPVGAIYMSANNVSPQVFLGGTWATWGAGRVPLAVGSNGETNYTAAEQTGGSENSVASHNHTQNSHTHTQNSHTHTQNAHNHSQNSHNHSQNSHTHNLTMRINGTQYSREQVQVTTTNNNNDYYSTDIRLTGGSVNTSSFWNARDRMWNTGATASNNATTASNNSETATNQATTATNNATTPTNNATGTAGGNRQPFITCYMWKRTA